MRDEEGYPETVFRRSECAVFLTTRDRFGRLSNMARGLPIRAFGQDIPSSEALYQALRFPQHPKIQEAILLADSPKDAKNVARRSIHETRSDWAAVRIPAMAWVVRLKLHVHPVKFGEELASTGTSVIVEESSRDSFWGAVPRGTEILVGQNVLGRLLTAERDLMLSDGIPAPDRLEPPFPEAILLGRAWDVSDLCPEPAQRSLF